MTLTPLDPDTVTASLRPPPLADLARKARRRTRRRRVTAAAAVLATLAGAVMLTGPFGTGQPDTPPATSSPTQSPTENAVRYVSPDLAGPPDEHLYMRPLDRTTAVSVDRTGCRITVRLTTDAGRTWTAPGGPPAPENCTSGTVEARPLTVVDILAYRITIAGRSWFTTDAGRTWTSAPGDRVVDSFPPGRRGESLECAEGCDRPRAVDPATGGLLVLRSGPPFERFWNVVRADRNVLWAIEKAGRPRASHSTDGGRTWSAPVDLPATTEDVNIVASGPDRAYVTWLTNEPRFRIYRTDDGGRTWTELDLPGGYFNNLTETATGRLIILSLQSGPQAWTSTDRGATFTGPMTLDVPAPLSGGNVPGLVVASGDDRARHVNDGTGWYTIQPPG